MIKFRTKKPELSADYDRNSDVLYVTLGQARPGEGESRPNGVVLRYSMDGDDPIGVTVIGVNRNGWKIHIADLAAIVSKHVNVLPQLVEQTIRKAIR